ncbi:hypothetical protein ZWY2020_003801 [Hordeum vulgare]|nr:hypothetical protein ZWY2020_003801 [Hordeum vulgare]
MLAGSAQTWLNSLPAGSVNSWVDFEEAFIRNFTGTYKRPGRPCEMTMSIQRPDQPLRDYVTRWTELRNSCEGVHEVHAIQYFIDGYRDGTLLKHKLMCSEPTSLVVLMAKADKYATTDSIMRVKNNNKRKADQLDLRSNNKLVANVEGEASATQAGSQQRRTSKNDWQPKQSFEQMLDAPYKMHSGAKPSTIPFDSLALHDDCRKRRACRLPQAHLQRLMPRLSVQLRLHRHRPTTTAVSTTTTPIETEHSSSSPVKGTTSTTSASTGVR